MTDQLHKFIDAQDWPEPIKEEARIIAKIHRIRSVPFWDEDKWDEWAESKKKGMGGV